MYFIHIHIYVHLSIHDLKIINPDTITAISVEKKQLKYQDGYKRAILINLIFLSRCITNLYITVITIFIIFIIKLSIACSYCEYAILCNHDGNM